MRSRTTNAKPACRPLPPNVVEGAISRKVAASFRAILLSVFTPMLVAGCGASSGTPPKIAERPNVTITLDGNRHACVVALDKEPQGSTVPCKEAVSFVKDELRVQPGSVYDIHTIATVGDTEIASVRAALDEAGYRFIGGRKLP
jgi:hypothetical protein